MASPFPYDEAIAKGSELLNGILKRVLPEKVTEAERLTASTEITKMMLEHDFQLVMGQLLINQEEAKHDNIFIAGWRPAMGWVCDAAFAYTFLCQPFIVMVYAMIAQKLPPLPTLDMWPMLTVLGGMLGISISRSYEKVKGETTTATKVGA